MRHSSPRSSRRGQSLVFTSLLALALVLRPQTTVGQTFDYEDALEKAILFPSGDQLGRPSVPVAVNRRVALASAAITKMLVFSCALSERMNAISFPSGDHVGASLVMLRGVKHRSAVPSALRTQIWEQNGCGSQRSYFA